MVPDERPRNDRDTFGASLTTVASVLLAVLVTVSTAGVAVAVPAGSPSGDAPTAAAPAAPAPGSQEAAATGPASARTGADPVPTAGIERAESVRDGGGPTASVSEGAASPCPADLGDDACITGRVMYRDGDGNLRPARRVTVYLMDDDIINHKVTGTRTDANGRFAFVFDPDDLEWGKTASVFVKVFSENPAAEATTTVARVQYKAMSETKKLDPGDTLRMGRFWPSEHNDAWRAIDATLTARQRIADESGGWTRDQVRIQYPAPLSDRPQAIGIPGFRHIALPEPDTWDWDRSTVHHEYGHMVMDTMYDYNILKWPAEAAEFLGACHVQDSETNPGFAWIEGWAEFVQAAVADDPNADGMTLESGSYYDRSDSNGDCPAADAGGEFDGASVEGSVASILWDVYDGKNDDGLDYTLGEILATFDSADPKNVNQFWNAFVTEDNRADLREIYHQNGILKEDRFESNDDPSSAHRIEPNGTIEAQINRGESDYFAVDLEEGQKLTADLDYSTADGDVDLAIEGPDGEVMAAATGNTGEASLAVVANSSGTYHVVASGEGSASAPYELTVEVPEGGAEVALPKGGCDGASRTIEGELDGKGNGMVHTVEVPVNCSVSIGLSGPAGEDFDLYVTLDGRPPSTNDFAVASRTGGSDETVTLDATTVRQTETIAVRVQAYAGSGDYTLVVETDDDS